MAWSLQPHQQPKAYQPHAGEIWTKWPTPSSIGTDGLSKVRLMKISINTSCQELQGFSCSNGRLCMQALCLRQILYKGLFWYSDRCVGDAERWFALGWDFLVGKSKTMRSYANFQKRCHKSSWSQNYRDDPRPTTVSDSLLCRLLSTRFWHSNHHSHSRRGT